jgi:hypothetical protein
MLVSLNKIFEIKHVLKQELPPRASDMSPIWLALESCLDTTPLGRGIIKIQLLVYGFA